MKPLHEINKAGFFLLNLMNLRVGAWIIPTRRASTISNPEPAMELQFPPSWLQKSSPSYRASTISQPRTQGSYLWEGVRR